MYESDKEKLTYNQKRCYELLKDKTLNKDWFNFLDEYKKYLPEKEQKYYDGELYAGEPKTLL